MSEQAYPLLWKDGGGEILVVVEPRGHINRMWYGPGPADWFDVEGPNYRTAIDMRWAMPRTESPIGSRFD